jgi:hypothetical protein
MDWVCKLSSLCFVFKRLKIKLSPVVIKIAGRNTMYIYDNGSPNSSQNQKYFRQPLQIQISKHTFYIQYLFSENLVFREIM